jgi:hypothetical protein
MGTEIIGYEDCDATNTNVLLKRFWGGKDRGTCYSLLERDSVYCDMYASSCCIEIDEKTMDYMIYKKLKKDYDEMQDKDTLYSGHIRYIGAIKGLIVYLREKWGWD